ncbi:MAG TPA: hypothetical protein PKN52_06740, partial [Trueperaceae bacterium]|nr:hypothetical protein [Trueperaceae bacterium]
MPSAIDVLLPLPIGQLTYLPPVAGRSAQDDDAVMPAPGQRVVVPWQAGVRIGIVIDVRTVDAGRGLELRHAVQTLESRPWLTRAGLATTLQLARHSGVPAGLVLATLNPPGLQQELDHQVRVHAGADDYLSAMATPLKQSVTWQEGWSEWLPAAAVPAKGLEELRRQGLVDERVLPVVPTRTVLVPAREPDDELEGARRLAQRIALQHQHAQAAVGLQAHVGVQ